MTVQPDNAAMADAPLLISTVTRKHERRPYTITFEAASDAMVVYVLHLRAAIGLFRSPPAGIHLQWIGQPLQSSSMSQTTGDDCAITGANCCSLAASPRAHGISR
jgi:hypothetical protein